ncbi:MAG: serine/threonine-protein kinase, partial [Holophagae bacterium]
MPSSGQPLSHFTILEPLGKGGMGQVFLAEDTSLDRKVALKFLSEEALQDPVARQRFLREAKSAAALDNPFICQIYETGEVDNEPFIAMEYVEGESLAERLRRGPLPVDEALKIGCEVAEALEAAHEHGIAHRDLKPANIMLSAKGHAKVMDFGLAKRVAIGGEIDSEGETAATDHLTATGAAIGTLAYMSPEQLKAEPLQPSTDIFSFGVVLFEMLTGGHPFHRPSSAETIKAIMLDPPADLEIADADVPTALAPVLEKALAKDPADRYQSGAEMVGDFRRLCATVGAVQSPPSRTRWAMSALAVVAAAVISLGLYFALRDGAPVDVTTPEPVSVLIADFDNTTGDDVFDGVLEQAMVIGLEEASFIDSYKRSEAVRAAEQIQGQGAELD